MAERFVHVPHPHILLRRRPVVEHGGGLNDRLAAWGTKWFGSMPAFYLFAAYGALGAVFLSAQGTLLYWSNWIQLWSLPLLMVGANVLNRKADLRAQQTYDDAEAVLHECLQLQEHLRAQDVVLADLIERVQAKSVRKRAAPVVEPVAAPVPAATSAD